MPLHVEFSSDISKIKPGQWNALEGTECPFVSHAFLSALEQSGCVNQDSGWLPNHVLIYDQQNLVAAMPSYLKHHSYGEYVFDHAWANAYYRHGLNYYPKLVCAVPFTPVTGARLLTKSGTDLEQVCNAVTQAINHYATQHSISSMHWLFVSHYLAQYLKNNHHHLTRKSVQFVWYNRDFNDFNHFLELFASRKRKNILKERRRLLESGVTISRLSGDDISSNDLDTFYLCYQQTYLKRSGHSGYLNRDFFNQLLQTMRDRLLIVTAKTGSGPAGSAMFLYDKQGLYGRYWGALQDISGLHFECCYYQGIEFAIEKRLNFFNPGTQGEHKILRGFEPTYCYSSHILYEPAFHAAVDSFLKQETPAIEHYKQDADTLLPFKSDVIRFVPDE